MKKTIAAAVVSLALLAPGASAQEPEVTANAGYVSQYIFRGIPQSMSSASAGLDLAVSGLYAGTWTADVGDGQEVDLYAGYGVEVGELSLSVGGTGYFYTGDFDVTYLEGNASAAVGPLGVDLALGQHKTDPTAEDYGFVSVSLAQAGFYALFGTFFRDWEGSYGEAGYEFTVSDIDFSVAWVLADENLSLLGGRADNTLVFGVSKTFTLN